MPYKVVKKQTKWCSNWALFKRKFDPEFRKHP
jgi:hypothetical protein